MELSWVREEAPVWDADKKRVIGGAPEGAFVIPFADGEELPGEWWSARDDEAVVGYGRLDTTWGGDAEILLAVDTEAPRQQSRAAEEYDVRSDPGGRAPGHEEQGGYVDVDEHRY